MTPQPAPGYRIERCGNLYVYHPVNPRPVKP